MLPAYPNPFNPSTTISIDLNKAGTYTLELYDVTGKLLATVLNKFYQPGKYSIKLEKEFQNLPSTIYFVKLSTENNFKIQRVIFLK